MSLQSIPPEFRNLRACLLCKMIKTYDQFHSQGCDNCERYLQIRGNKKLIYKCTSASFEGFIAALDPKNSWVCRWQRIDSKAKGMYAISVKGSLPREILQEMRIEAGPKSRKKRARRNDDAQEDEFSEVCVRKKSRNLDYESSDEN